MKRQHRVTFRKGDTRATMSVWAAKNAESDAIVNQARAENSIGRTWKPESIDLLRFDKTVQRTTLL